MQKQAFSTYRWEGFLHFLLEVWGWNTGLLRPHVLSVQVLTLTHANQAAVKSTLHFFFIG
jgi:hypothetical protein